MQKSPLGSSPLMVSRLCLGSMTWGSQNTAEEAFSQIDYALDHGINFIDTAELYPTTPSAAETSGGTERIIGAWLERSGRRGEVVLATKIAGAGNRTVRPDGAPIGPATLRTALDGSLKRLRTDYIDLYQLHWPQRSTNFFGQLGYRHKDVDTGTPLEETLGALADMVAAGKVRAVGVSNETPWGLMRLLALAEAAGLPRVAAIQNPYSLTNRVFEVGLAEPSIREDCPLLAYSPLAFGTLTGKYLDGTPEKSRLALYPQFTRYVKAPAVEAVRQYVALARDHGLDPARMAIAYVAGRPFTGAAIIGATTPEQLANNLAAQDLTLSDDVVAGIEAIHEAHPNPSP